MSMYKDYNTNQLSLKVNLAYDIPPSHEAKMIILFVDSIPSQVLLEEASHTGRPAFLSSHTHEDDPVRLRSSSILWT